MTFPYTHCQWSFFSERRTSQKEVLQHDFGLGNLGQSGTTHALFHFLELWKKSKRNFSYLGLVFLHSCALPAGSMLPVPNAFSLLSNMRGKPRRGMLRRAVFSDLQRKGLEKTFQKQKYISKPDRKKLADKLGLKDSQVSNHGLSLDSFDSMVAWCANNPTDFLVLFAPPHSMVCLGGGTSDKRKLPRKFWGESLQTGLKLLDIFSDIFRTQKSQTMPNMTSFLTAILVYNKEDFFKNQWSESSTVRAMLGSPLGKLLGSKLAWAKCCSEVLRSCICRKFVALQIFFCHKKKKHLLGRVNAFTMSSKKTSHRVIRLNSWSPIDGEKICINRQTKKIDAFHGWLGWSGHGGPFCVTDVTGKLSEATAWIFQLTQRWAISTRHASLIWNW